MILHTPLILSIIFITASFSTASYAASFDCKKATTFIEKEICNDNELSKLDEQLAHLYKFTLNDSADPKTFKKQQRKWLKLKRNKCSTIACLKLTYQVRIDLFQQIKSQTQKINPVGQYERKDKSASINITQLANGYLHVSGDATLVVNIEKGDVRLGTLEGEFPLNNQDLSLHYQDNTVNDGCQLDIKFFATKLQVSHDNNQCGGLNVSFNGDYQRVK